MVTEFLRYIEDNKLAGKSDRILAAVSGGIDSMVMADLLMKSGLLHGIAHCNFRLRGRDSGLDEKLVKRYAARNKIPFFSIRFDTKHYASEKGISVEMAARELRYSWFRKIMKEEGYASVAVAHNLNDNIETLLLNLIRGTGIAGLTGIKPSASNIIRPLLFAPRKSIEDYCNENSISYREDKSNADTRIIRNKIRHKVIPLLREINPSVESTLNETAERLSGINEIISEVMAATRLSIFREGNGIIAVELNSLKPFLNNKTFLFELFRPYGLTGSLTDDLLKIIKGRTGGHIFTETYRMLKNRKEILISHLPADANTTFIAENLTELKKCPQIISVKTISAKKVMILETDPGTALLDFGKITFPVIIRKWHPGDFFYPLGMDRKKKLSDYFIDRKVSLFGKERTMILETGGEIAWVIGSRIDNRFRITGSTKKVLMLKAQGHSGSLAQRLP